MTQSEDARASAAFLILSRPGDRYWRGMNAGSAAPGFPARKGWSLERMFSGLFCPTSSPGASLVGSPRKGWELLEAEEAGREMRGSLMAPTVVGAGGIWVEI